MIQVAVDLTFRETKLDIVDFSITKNKYEHETYSTVSKQIYFETQPMVSYSASHLASEFAMASELPTHSEQVAAIRSSTDALDSPQGLSKVILHLWLMGICLRAAGKAGTKRGHEREAAVIRRSVSAEEKVSYPCGVINAFPEAFNIRELCASHFQMLHSSRALLAEKIEARREEERVDRCFICEHPGVA